ncbi:C-terminal binding protein [Haladaptatus sp. NG-SE-30]
MSPDRGVPTVALTAASQFDCSVERDAFTETNIEFHPVDVSTSDDLAALSGVDAVVDRLFVAPYTSDVLDSLADGGCRVIVRCGIGVDGIDLEAAAQAGVYVANVPSYCEYEVAEHAFALTLALQRNLFDYHDAMRTGEWNRRLGAEIHRLRGQTVGLIGFGTIARLVAEKAQAFGMEIVSSDPYVDADEMAKIGVEKRTFEEVLTTADIISIHAPLTDETEGLLDAKSFAMMKSTAYVVNVARGELLVEEDLLAALDSGEIAGAGLDVFADEPADHDGPATIDNPLCKRDDVLMTPHVAWYSVEADEQRRRTAATDVLRVLNGDTPENGVNDPQ